MNLRDIKNYCLVTLSVAIAMLSGCGGESRENTNFSNSMTMAAAPTNLVTFEGPRSNYYITKSLSNYSIYDAVGNEGLKIIPRVNEVKFADVTLVFNMEEQAAQIPRADYQILVELYIAFFNRVPDSYGLSYWISRFNAGMTIEEISNSFYSAAIETSSLTGYSANMSNSDFVKIIYKNVLGRDEVDKEGLDYWSTSLSNGTQSRGMLIKTILDSAHKSKGNPTYGKVADLLDNKFTVANSFATLGGVNFNTVSDAIRKGTDILAAVTSTDISAAMVLVNERSTNTKSPVTAVAGADQQINLGQTVTLIGSGTSRLAGASISYDWSITKKPLLSNISLSNSKVLSPTFNPDVEGEYELALTTSDGTYVSFPSTVRITVKKIVQSFYVVSGTVNGLLTGKQITLSNNSGNSTTISVNGAFSFSQSVIQGSNYLASIDVQPIGQTCTINNGSGSNITANVTNVQVMCSSGGMVSTKIGINGSAAFGVAIQADGKIVAAGNSVMNNQDQDVALARYNIDGSLDTNFGQAGVVTTNISGRIASTDWIRGIAIQNDGKIIVAGYTQKRGDPAKGLVILRYDTNGNLDPDFSGTGIVQLIDPIKDLFINALALQSDGKIVIAGGVNCTNRFTAGFCTLVKRFNSDGSVDPSFNGPDNNRVDSSTQGAQGIALQSDGKVLVVGTRNTGNGDELSVARYKGDGQLDSSFGSSGITTVAIGFDVGSFNNGSSIALQSDGSIFVAGTAHSNSANNHFSLTKLRNNGLVDTTFGKLGSVVTYVATPPDSDYAYGVVVQPDGKILVAGESTVARTNTFPFPGFVSLANVNFALVRYTASGSLDTTFGGTGIVTADMNLLDDRCYGIAIQPNGSIVLVGGTFIYAPSNNSAGYSSFGLIRYKPDGTLDSTFSPAK